MNRTRRRGRGLALVEMIFVLIIAGVAMVIAARLFALTARAYRQSASATNALRGQQQWLGMLRDDAWAANAVTADDGPDATFALAGGPARWAREEASLTRTLGDDVRRWPLDRPLRWRWSGRSLLVVAGDVEVPLATPSLRAREAR